MKRSRLLNWHQAEPCGLDPDLPTRPPGERETALHGLSGFGVKLKRFKDNPGRSARWLD